MFVGWSTLGILLGLNLQSVGDEINQDFDLKKTALKSWDWSNRRVLPIYSSFWQRIYSGQMFIIFRPERPMRKLS